MRYVINKLRTHPHGRRYGSILLVFLLILVMFRVWGAWMLRYHTHRLAVPLVNIITASRVSVREKLILPGTLAAWHEAPIYARTNGYVKEWLVDIGDRVKQGDVLAVIETPELDAKLRQAEAHVQVVLAKAQLAQVTAIRWENLLKSHSVSKQETDEKVNAAKASHAAVMAARANQERLQQLVRFEKVAAPFTGIISDRLTDLGALINAGGRSTEVHPLFRIVQQDKLRLYVNIPENDAPRILPNMMVRFRLAEYPGQTFQAKLFKTADAINPTTRTLQAQFIVDNAESRLMPGSYTEVYFELPPLPNAVRLSVNTLLFRSAGLEVATLDQQDRVILKPIVISRDEGDTVEIATGIQPGERVIVNPSDALFQGQQVKVVKVHFKNPVLGTA